jgi:hypothetical protein
MESTDSQELSYLVGMRCMKVLLVCSEEILRYRAEIANNEPCVAIRLATHRMSLKLNKE